jgi:hypothetical protein
MEIRLWVCILPPMLNNVAQVYRKAANAHRTMGAKAFQKRRQNRSLLKCSAPGKPVLSIGNVPRLRGSIGQTRHWVYSLTVADATRGGQEANNRARLATVNTCGYWGIFEGWVFSSRSGTLHCREVGWNGKYPCHLDSFLARNAINLGTGWAVIIERRELHL